MSNSNSKNNPIVITDAGGKKRTIQIMTLIGSNGDLINFTNNGLDVNIQDQHTPVIMGYMSFQQASSLLTNNIAINDTSFDIDDTTNFAIGQYLSLFNIAANRFYLASILDISGNTITVDTPLDFAYTSGSFVTGGNRNMNVDGSTTSVIYGLRNTEQAIGSTFDITRIMFTCTTDGRVDLSKFGDITGGIVNGIVFRQKNGTYNNIFNAKTNGDLANLMYDWTPYDSQNVQQGQNGFVGRLTFGGQSKVGVVIRLEPGEDIQLIIQDDLSDILSLSVLAEGHIVE